MDEKLQAQMEEARAQGYTDEQIQAYLNPPPVERLDQKKDQSGNQISPFVNRHEETTGLVQYGAAKAAELGLEGYGLYKIGQGVGRAFGVGTPTAPVAPTNLPSATSPQGSIEMLKGNPTAPGTNPYATPAAGPVRTAGPVLSSAVPAAAFSAPYAMAAYEQERIRANPNAPGLETNPYAQQYRGEYATQGAAGAANRRQAIAGQQYGGLSESDQMTLDQDRLNMAIRLRAAKKVLGPTAP